MAEAESEDLNHSDSTSNITKEFTSSSNMYVPNKQLTYRYDREEMLALRENKFSRTRPAMLLKEFDNEDGLFSPDKWLQYKWQCEGVENRVKRKQLYAATTTGSNQIGSSPVLLKPLSSIAEASANNIPNDLDNQTILSPQRRGFASGCRATSETHEEEKRHNQSSKARWRQGQLNNGTDFKPSFQKSTLEATSRSNRSTTSNQNNASNPSLTLIGPSKHWEKNRRGQDRERTQSINTENESVPEWMDEGPVSVSDVIELKGFDDDPGTGKKKERRHSTRTKESSNGQKTKKDINHIDVRAMTEEPTRPRSSARQKRHSGGDIAHLNNSRPSSRQTPHSFFSVIGSRKNSATSPAPIRFIQASDLESSILKEQQEKLNKQKVIDSRSFDLLTALGIESTELKSNEPVKSPGNKMPNSDAEFAAFILGLSAEQIAKPTLATGAENAALNSTISLAPGAKQNLPKTSRLSRFFAKNTGNVKEELETENVKNTGDLGAICSEAKFDLSALHAYLEQQRSSAQQSAAPTNATQYFNLNHQHLVNTDEHPNQHQQTRSPLLQVPQQDSIPNFIFGDNTQANLPVIPVVSRATPEFNAQRAHILQQMQIPAPGPVPNFNSLPQQQYFSGQFPGHIPSQHGIPPPFPSNYFGPRAPSPYNVPMPPHIPPHSVLTMNQFGLSAGTAGRFSSQHGILPPFPPNYFGPRAPSPYGVPMPPHIHPYTGTVPMTQFGLSAGTAGINPSTYLRTSYQNPGRMPFPPPLSISQQQPLLPPPPPTSRKSSFGHHHNQNLLNSPAFMPTSVMRQISKVPSTANSISGCSEQYGSTTLSNSTPPPFLQKLFADVKVVRGGVSSPTSALRAILGRDPTTEQPTISTKPPTKISGCLKLEEIEQQQLREIKQQQQIFNRNECITQHPY